MSDVLENIDQAVAMWYESLVGTLDYYKLYQSHSYMCTGGGSQTYEDRIVGYDVKGAVASASLIGTDTTTCISYFHLTGIQLDASLLTGNFNCCGPFGFADAQTQSDVVVNVTDGSSDTVPYDGSAIIPHSGYPVCAAILGWNAAGTGHWLPIQAGESAGPLNLSNAKAGVGVNASATFCSSGCDDIEATLTCS